MCVSSGNIVKFYTAKEIDKEFENSDNKIEIVYSRVDQRKRRNFADYLCCLPIFKLSFKCVPKRLSVLKIFKARDIVRVRLYTGERNIEVQFVMFSYKTRIGGRFFHRRPAIYWIFTQTKLSNIYRRKFLCLKETSRAACDSYETQTRKMLLLFRRDRLCGKILASMWKE